MKTSSASGITSSKTPIASFRKWDRKNWSTKQTGTYWNNSTENRMTAAVISMNNSNSGCSWQNDMWGFQVDNEKSLDIPQIPILEYMECVFVIRWGGTENLCDFQKQAAPPQLCTKRD